MKKYLIFSFICFMLLMFAGASNAEIRVVSVKGTAAYKAGGQWVPLKPGMVLTAGTKISTGVNSDAEIKINRHTIKVHSLTIMKISEGSEDAKTSTTRLGIRRGSVYSKIEKDARIKTVFKVSTPIATSSVRGSSQLTFSGPSLGSTNFFLTGSGQANGLNGSPKILSGGLLFNQKPGSGGSGSLMSGMQFITLTSPGGLTGDEQNSIGQTGDDTNSSGGGGGNTFNPNILQIMMGTSQVNIIINWPN